MMRSLLVIVAGMLAGMMGAGAAAPGFGADDWEVPEEERAIVNPIASNDTATERGKAHYEKHCLMCHGETGNGDGKMAKFVKPAPGDISTEEAQTRMTDGEIFYKISRGKTPMPQFKGKLSDEDRWNLVHFVRSLRDE